MDGLSFAESHSPGCDLAESLSFKNCLFLVKDGDFPSRCVAGHSEARTSIALLFLPRDDPGSGVPGHAGQSDTKTDEVLPAYNLRPSPLCCISYLKAPVMCFVPLSLTGF